MRSERAVLAALGSSSYETTASRFGLSRAAVWRIAKRHGARKHEPRIAERERAQRGRDERIALLEAAVAGMGETKTADVLSYLGTIPDGCAQIVLTSPPYNIGRSYDGKSNDKMRHLAYLGWMIQVVSECARVLKPGGVFALQIGATRLDDGSLKPLDWVLEEYLYMAGLTYQNRIVWPSDHGLTPKARLAERAEYGLVFSKGPYNVFNATPARTPQKHPGKRAFRGPNCGKLSGHPLGAAPTDVWTDVEHLRANHRERTPHPAQMSLAYARKTILLYSMPGDLIIDPFSGSGTTQLASFQTGRAFDGADVAYADVRAARLADAEPDSASVLPGVSAESLAIWQAEAHRVHVPADPAQLAFSIGA